jgi:hypothetical protein
LDNAKKAGASSQSIEKGSVTPGIFQKLEKKAGE